MKKWNEVLCKTGIELVEKIMRNEPWTRNEILEIQNPISTMEGIPYRIYVGNCFDEILGTFPGAYLVTVNPIESPLVLPMIPGLNSPGLPFLGSPGASTSPRWWRKSKSGIRLYYPGEYPMNLNDTYVRVRMIGKSTWKTKILQDRMVWPEDEDIRNFKIINPL